MSSNGVSSLPAYSWEEIAEHKEKSSRWLVIDDYVYDVTSWSKKHPGGSILLGHFAGQDATEAFAAFHRNSIDYVRKFLKPLRIGRLEKGQSLPHTDVKEDFEKLRQTAEKMGLFNSSYVFFALVLLQIFALEVGSYLVLSYYGVNWLTWIVSVFLAATAQTQLGWHQHDAGHLSVFRNNKLNRIYHIFLICFLKGTSGHWWNHMHYQHHSKPNVIGKDPDVRMDKLFLVGNVMPVEKAKEESKPSMPYQKQHNYFFLIGPPLLFPVYFQFMTFRHAYTRRLYLEGFLMILYYARVFVLLYPLLGSVGAVLVYYEVMRVIESHWFTWVTQSNHIPMTIEKDEPTGRAWLLAQLKATCNIEKSFFNDWFTGHLNFQVEHHLFPQMPRHNYYKVAPLVSSLCTKHGVEYKVKPLLTAFKDIVRSLEHSGQLWLHTYEEFHSS
ncbi:hypothetical protein EB796_013634 [Bugula neritina]|uniref:Cytochrome b5 heme-binding domain-containing protein n=1 Tax=Bugula neritina TaxID=10212 RepID=A0A7J7JPY6_BUGNE|nr:hypothetical protein EB796_013634 [Bugula neritina]